MCLLIGSSISLYLEQKANKQNFVSLIVDRYLKNVPCYPAYLIIEGSAQFGKLRSCKKPLLVFIVSFQINVREFSYF